MAKDKVKFKVFKLTNVFEKNDEAILNYYNHRITKFILDTILNHKKIDRKKTYNNKTETIYILNYNDFYSEDLGHGQIVTIRHGQEQRNVNVEDLELVGLIQTDEGIEFVIDFFIDKSKGFIFVEQDKNYVLTIAKLRSIIRSFKKETNFFVKYLNSLNSQITIDYNPYINVEIVKPLDIKKQIKSLRTIDKVSIHEKDNISYENIQDIDFDGEDNNNFLKNIHDGINKYNIDGFKSTFTLRKFSTNKLTKNLENFIEYIVDSDKFGSYRVEGIDAFGVQRAFTPDSLTRDIQFDAKKDVRGYISKDIKYRFITSYMKENESNLPNTKKLDEPPLIDITEFLKGLEKIRGDVEGAKRKSEKQQS